MVEVRALKENVPQEIIPSFPRRRSSQNALPSETPAQSVSLDAIGRPCTNPESRPGAHKYCEKIFKRVGVKVFFVSFVCFVDMIFSKQTLPIQKLSPMSTKHTKHTKSTKSTKKCSTGLGAWVFDAFIIINTSRHR